MNYHYPNTIVVIVDNLTNYHSACHLFANVHRNANLITAHQRVNMIHKAAVAQHQGSEPPAATLVQLVEAHKYAMASVQDVDYYIKDIENAMVRADKQSKPDQFHVILVLEGLFKTEQIKRIKAKKIYFYEDRGVDRRSIDAIDYINHDNDYFKTLGFSGSMVNLALSVSTLYSQLGFKV